MSMTDNEFSRVESVRLQMRNVATGETLASTWNPQIFMVPRDSYQLRVVSAPWKTSGELASGTLPCRVRSWRNNGLYWRLLKTASLTPFSFSVLASPGGLQSFSGLQHAGDSMTVDISTEYWRYEWWGAFVIPDTLAVAELRGSTDTSETTLTPEYDYVTEHVGNLNLVSVRIDPWYTHLSMSFRAPGSGLFKAHFRTLAGVPTPAESVTIADGMTVQKFGNVTDVEAVVGETISVRYRLPSGDSARLTWFVNQTLVPPGGVTEWTYYKLDTLRERIRPYILGEETGAGASIIWTWDGADSTVRCTVYTALPDKEVMIGVFANLLEQQELPIAYVSGRGTDAASWSVHGDYHYDEGGFACSYGYLTYSSKVSTGASQKATMFWNFDPVPDGSGVLTDMTMTDNEFSKVESVRLQMRNVATGETLASTWNPQIFMVPRDSYQLRVVSAPWKTSGELVSGILPCHVRNWRNNGFDWRLQKTASLTPFSFSVLASPGGLQSFSGLQHAGDSMTVDVSTEYWRYEWWGAFVIPDTLGVAELRGCTDTSTTTLEPEYDYVIEHIGNLNFVSVRIDPWYTHLSMSFRPAGISSSNSPTAFALSIAPNPFSRTTGINYSLPRATDIALKLYDVTGALTKVLAQGPVAAGRYTMRLDARKLAKGIYFIKFESAEYRETRKLIVE